MEKVGSEGKYRRSDAGKTVGGRRKTGMSVGRNTVKKAN